MTQSARVTLLKALQLAVSSGVVVLFWLIYSGDLLLFTGAFGLCYVVVSILALLDKRIGIWLAFGFTLLAFVFSAWGVYRYVDNGFEFLSGNFPGRTGFYWPAYLFVLVALGSLAVILLNFAARDRLLRGRADRRPA